MDEVKPNDKALLARLDAIAQSESDAELRADLFGTEVLGAYVGNRKICYLPVPALQTLAPAEADCSGSGAPGDDRLMAHYRHAPLQGAAPRM